MFFFSIWYCICFFSKFFFLFLDTYDTDQAIVAVIYQIAATSNYEAFFVVYYRSSVSTACVTFFRLLCLLIISTVCPKCAMSL